mmetsp:Transcript_78228/g.155453  ORF Transcript_78228/g.155453 Transcript_78228/m.155453 type:complete len:314 (-) Transcript_78228:237-1178(-)
MRAWRASAASKPAGGGTALSPAAAAASMARRPMMAAPRAMEESSSLAPGFSAAIASPAAADAASASESTCCTHGMRQPPPTISTALSAADAAVSSAPTSMALATDARVVSSKVRRRANGSEQSSLNSSRVAVRGTSMPSMRFSAVADASFIVESSLRRRSVATLSRSPRRLAMLTPSPYLAAIWAAKWSSSLASKSAAPRNGSEPVATTSWLASAVPTSPPNGGVSLITATTVEEAPMSRIRTRRGRVPSSALAKGHLRASATPSASAAVGAATSFQPPMAAASASVDTARASAPSVATIEGSAIERGAPSLT